MYYFAKGFSVQKLQSLDYILTMTAWW